MKLLQWDITSTVALSVKIVRVYKLFN